MEDKEIRFWDSVNKLPNNMEEDEWEAIRADYHRRKEIEKNKQVAIEKELFENIIKRFELNFYKWFSDNLELTPELDSFLYIDEETNDLISKKWGEVIGTIDDLIKYYDDAVDRDDYYKTLDSDLINEEKYSLWLSDKTIKNEDDDEVIGMMRDFLIENEWIEVMDGYWCTMESFNSGGDYYQGSRPLQQAYETEKSNQESINIAKNQQENKNDLIIKLNEDDEWNF
jgi:hypothetical protein